MKKTNDLQYDITLLNDVFNFLSKRYPLKRSPQGLNSLQRKQIRALERRETWSIIVDVDTGLKICDCTLNIVLPKDFPLSLPRIYLSNDHLNAWGILPNINVFGFICTFDPELNIPDPKYSKEILIQCLHQAVKIIEDGIQGKSKQNINEEFLAYWGDNYYEEPQVNLSTLSLLPLGKQSSDNITYVQLKKFFGRYEAIIYSEKEQFKKIKEVLKYRKIEYEEFRTFDLGPLREFQPPFNLTTHKVTRLIQKLGKQEAFDNYLKCGTKTPIITFHVKVQNESLILLWKHENLPNTENENQKKLNRQKSKERQAALFYSSNYQSKHVSRISPQIISKDRLSKRTAYIEQPPLPKKIFVAGLGSVGSNLIELLEIAGVEEFVLVDNDLLNIENIKRHLLGFNFIGLSKVQALKEYLYSKYPLIRIESHKSTVHSFVNSNIRQLNTCDYLLFCIGSFNTEVWISQILRQGILKKPCLFIWVEPYLLGGHCVYLHPEDDMKLENLFESGIYKYNIIAATEHIKRQFHKKELGCQSTYFPYDGLTLKLFLTNLVPSLLKIFSNTTDKSKMFSWTGDLEKANTLNIKLSPQAADTSFNLRSI